MPNKIVGKKQEEPKRCNFRSTEASKILLEISYQIELEIRESISDLVPEHIAFLCLHDWKYIKQHIFQVLTVKWTYSDSFLEKAQRRILLVAKISPKHAFSPSDHQLPFWLWESVSPGSIVFPKKRKNSTGHLRTKRWSKAQFRGIHEVEPEWKLRRASADFPK